MVGHELVRSWLREMDEGAIASHTAVGLVFAEGWLELGQPTGLDGLIALMDDWDDMPTSRGELVGSSFGALMDKLSMLPSIAYVRELHRLHRDIIIGGTSSPGQR